MKPRLTALYCSIHHYSAVGNVLLSSHIAVPPLTGEMEKHIRLLSEVAPEWLTIHPIRKDFYLKLNKNMELNLVLDKLSSRLREEERVWGWCEGEALLSQLCCELWRLHVLQCRVFQSNSPVCWQSARVSDVLVTVGIVVSCWSWRCSRMPVCPKIPGPHGAGQTWSWLWTGCFKHVLQWLRMCFALFLFPPWRCNIGACFQSF